MANAVALAIVCAFILGGATYALLLAPATKLAASTDGASPADSPLSARVVDSTARMDARQLETLKLVSAPAALGHIDMFSTGGSNGFVLHSGTAPVAIGWAADPAKTLAAGLIFIVDSKRYDMTPWYGVDRPDVAQALAAPGLEKAGFQAPVPLAGLSDGKHRLSVGVLAADRRRLFILAGSADFVVRS